MEGRAGNGQAALDALDVDIGRRGTIRLQLLTQIRTAIHALRLPGGTRLPSTRAVAARFGISRTTVTEVFDQLLAEGMLIARHGSGTYVSPALPARAPRESEAKPATSWERVSRRGKLFADITTRSRYVNKEPQAFQPGVPAIDVFPFAAWSRIAASFLRRPPRELVSYGDPAGLRTLRDAVAAGLRDAHGVACDADQVVITTGSQQSLDLIMRLMLDPDEPVWLEEPGSLAVRAAFVSAGARVVAVPVDADGMMIDDGVAAEPRARLAHVTAASQWPTTAPLAAPRRAALVRWADAADAWIVEDEYDGVFRYDGTVPPSLRSLARADRVLSIGSFSLTTFPALRIGYVVVPHALVDAFVAAKAAIDRQGATLEHAVLAEFVHSGRYARHVRAMHEVYAERREALARCAREYLPSFAYASPRAGLHGILTLDAHDDVAVSRAAAARGISAVPLSRLYFGRPRRSGLLLGFGIASPGELRLAVRKLRDAIAEVPARRVRR